MTCVAAIADAAQGRVWMGSDSMVAAGDVVLLYAAPKVWTVGELTIGVAGNLTWLDLLRERVRWPRVPSSGLPRWVRVDVLDAILAAAAAEGLEFGDSDEDDGAIDGTAVLGVRGRLFVVDTSRTAAATREPFVAIGSGAAWATASLYETRDKPHSEKWRIRRALEASERYCASVRRPWRWVG